MGTDIHVSAVLLCDRWNRILTVRKRHTAMFMQPGGKPEPGETPAQTAIREVTEELGLTLDAERLDFLGRFDAPAANETGFRVVADCFTHPLEGTPCPAAEIEEIRWAPFDGPHSADLAPLMVERLIPAMVARRGFTLRPYRDADAAALLEVFQQAIRVTAAAHYDALQIATWAPAEVDLAAWAARRASADTIVAVRDGRPCGFADLRLDGHPTDTGLLDMLFVHPDAAGRGVARALVGAVVARALAAGLTRVETHASRAARPAFERFGFILDREVAPNWVRGVDIPNFDMHLDLPEPPNGVTDRLKDGLSPRHEDR